MVSEPVGLLTEIDNRTDDNALLRAARVVAAIKELHAAGYCLILLPSGAKVRVTNRRRRWRRRERRAS